MLSLSLINMTMATTATAITIMIPAIIRMTVEKNTKFIQSLSSSDFLSNLQDIRKKKTNTCYKL